MANTINDVMNVIASPDYGIKNIAGTTHEILAIMEGTHNSENNIHSIVDDVRNLLRKLVGVATEKKPIEIGGTSTKINHKHIQDILDETKSIRKAIDNISKILLNKQGEKNMPTVAKLSNKASEKVANAMIKNIEKQKSGGMAALVDAFTKLKDISLKDIILGNLKLKKITKLLENVKGDLNIKEKDLNAIIKLINATPEMIKSLSKIESNINKVIKNNTIKKLSIILVGENSILTISKTLLKNEKGFIKANSAAKNLKELTTSLNKAMIKMIITSFLSRMISDKSIQAIEKMLNNLTNIARKLSKEKNVINKGVEASKQVTILVSNLFATSMLLTTSIAPALLGSIGALSLKLMIETTMWSINTLSKNKKSIETSTKSAKALAVFAGQMAITSFMFATIAVTGIPAIAGMLLMKGILWLSKKMFKTLDKSKVSITKGAIVMLLMGGSLILYGIALKKISEATKGMEWKQFGMIAALTGTFAVAIAALGIPIVAGFVALGSITLGVMGLSLLTFSKSLKMINDMGNIPSKPLQQVLDTMNMVKNFFVENALDRKAIKNARRYKRMLRPFGNTIKHLAKLKEMGVIPMKLIYGALNAIDSIANYYINNPIERKVIKEARRYKRMLRPFGNTIKHLAKLKEMGVIPMKLVQGALNAMSVISNFYQNQNNDTFDNDNIKTNIYISSFADSVNALKTIKGIQTIPTIAISNIVRAMSDIINFYNTTKLDNNIDKKSTLTKSIISKFANICVNIQDNFMNVKTINLKNVEDNIKCLGLITKFMKRESLNSLYYKRARKTITLLKNMTSVMSDISNISTSRLSSIGSALTDALSGVNTIDMDQVVAVTNMFNAFNKINKSENIINKFAESVKEFTETCKDLMDAMGNNTDAINNMDTSNNRNSGSIFDNIKEKVSNFIGGESDSNASQTKTNGIRITNVDEVAKAIAEKINGAISVDMPDTQVQLLINGTGGNEWVITRY